MCIENLKVSAMYVFPCCLVVFMRTRMPCNESNRKTESVEMNSALAHFFFFGLRSCWAEKAIDRRVLHPSLLCLLSLSSSTSLSLRVVRHALRRVGVKRKQATKTKLAQAMSRKAKHIDHTNPSSKLSDVQSRRRLMRYPIARESFPNAAKTAMPTEPGL